MRTKLDERRWRERQRLRVQIDAHMLSLHSSDVAFVFVWHIIIYINVLFIKSFIICLRAPPSSLFSAELCSQSAAVSSFWQLFMQPATKLRLNMAIRWHTEICNRHNQSNTDAISNFITPFQSFSLTFSSFLFISSLICSPPHDHNPSSSTGTQSMKERGIDEGGE